MYRIDGKITRALNYHFASLPAQDKAIVEDAAKALTDLKINGLGRSTALEILHAIGQLMRRNERR